MNNAALKRAPEIETATKHLDRPPPGWFTLAVMRKILRKWDWVAVMVDVNPDELKHRKYLPGERRTAREAWVRIPGKHRNEEAACVALENMIATRH